MDHIERIIALAAAATVPLGAVGAAIWKVITHLDTKGVAPVVQGQAVTTPDLASYTMAEVADLRAELVRVTRRKRAYRDELLRLDQDPDEVLRRAGIID